MKKRFLLTVALMGFLDLTPSVRPAHAELIFGAPTLVPPPIYSGYQDLSPSLSSDGLELYFTSTRPGGGDDFATWRARRATTSETFGVPKPVTGLDHASISRDGLTLYGNEGNHPNKEIYVTTRPSVDAAWGAPQMLGGNVNSQWEDRWPEISSDELELYVTRGSLSTEIWVSRRLEPNEPFGQAVGISETINDGSAMAPALSDDGLTMFFASARDGGFGGYDLWASTRATEDSPWEEPSNLGPEINSAMGEWGPEISPDGGSLYFSRSAPDLSGTHDLWYAQQVPELSTGAMMVIVGLVTIVCIRRTRRSNSRSHAGTNLGEPFAGHTAQGIAKR